MEVGDLSLRIWENSGTKFEQFFDIILDYKWVESSDIFDNVVASHCSQGDYRNLPSPFSLKQERTVPFLMQIITVPTTPVDEDADPEATYVNISKHKNTLTVHMCSEAC